MGSYSPEDALHHAESGHMTYCELFAVFAALHTYRHVLRDSSALFVLDNLPDVHALNRQSTGSRRNAGLLREIYSIAVAFNIAISAEHRPGVDNVLADFLSRPSLHGHRDVVRAWRLAYPDDAARLVSVSHVFSRDFGGTRARPSRARSAASRCAPTRSAPTPRRRGHSSVSRLPTASTCRSHCQSSISASSCRSMPPHTRSPR